mgnify:FL=1
MREEEELCACWLLLLGPKKNRLAMRKMEKPIKNINNTNMKNMTNKNLNISLMLFIQ